MDIITGRTGKPHVTSQQDREINQAIFGSGNVVLNIGSCFEAEKIGDNKVRIKDGLLMLQGTGISIKNGGHEDVTIDNGTQSFGRIDYICAKYERISPEGIESAKLEVIKGVSSNIPQPPKFLLGNIRKGDTFAYFPLYKVTLEGVDIKAIEPLFKFADYKKILWLGENTMGANQQISLSEPISRQKAGIALVWTPVDADNNVHHQFIKKEAVELFPDTTHSIFLCNTAFTKAACKSVYVHDDTIEGNKYNTSAGAGLGISYNNADYTLRYVLGY